MTPLPAPKAASTQADATSTDLNTINLSKSAIAALQGGARRVTEMLNILSDESVEEEGHEEQKCRAIAIADTAESLARTCKALEEVKRLYA